MLCSNEEKWIDSFIRSLSKLSVFEFQLLVRNWLSPGNITMNKTQSLALKKSVYGKLAV